ncbi:MAG: hypothetical protein IPM29_01635 [Planctomycetes bacterium]|nr:hypothetical protein [Planctomycetota bacterium]
MEAHDRSCPEFEEIAQAVLRMEPLDEDQLERLARRARHGDTDARRRVVEATLHRVVARVRRHAEVGADLMELFEVGAAELGEAPQRWRPRFEPFVERVDRCLRDAMQPLLDEATARALREAAARIHGHAPTPHGAAQPSSAGR